MDKLTSCSELMRRRELLRQQTRVLFSQVRRRRNNWDRKRPGMTAPAYILKKEKHLASIWAKVRRPDTEIARQVSSRLVWFCEENSVRTPYMEDLKTYQPRAGNRTLSSNMSTNLWSKMLETTRYMRQSLGHTHGGIWTVNPAWTSRRCHVCGERGIRVEDAESTTEVRGGEYFYCPTCKTHMYADINAARNLSQSSAVPGRTQLNVRLCPTNNERCSKMKRYYVFMCSDCKRFTNAPVGQKHRRCSYCGKIINILKANVALFEDQNDAIAAVKKFNARGSDEFEKAIERSRERVRALVPDEPVSLDESSTEDSLTETVPAGRMKRLVALLETMATATPCNLDDLKTASEKRMLDWDWVEQTLSKLADDGSITFPRPWSVQMVRQSPEEIEKPLLKGDLTKEILRLLRDNGGEMQVSIMVNHYESAGVSRESVESSLNRLMQTGAVFEPKPGVLRLV